LIECYIRKHRYADLRMLASRFSSSLSTVRRALDSLESNFHSFNQESLIIKGLPLPYKPDSVHPTSRKKLSCTVIYLTSPR